MYMYIVMWSIITYIGTCRCSYIIVTYFLMSDNIDSCYNDKR